jgi:hypothetical protein
MRISRTVLAIAIAAAISPRVATSQQGECIYVSTFGPSSGAQCSVTPRVGPLNQGVWLFSCETGSPISSTLCPSYPTIIDQTPALLGSCYAQGTFLGPYVYSTCGSNKTFPSAPKMCATTDGSGAIGDPVDLTTGALSLDPADVDLGRGLRFLRHYSSNAANIASSQMGSSGRTAWTGGSRETPRRERAIRSSSCGSPCERLCHSCSLELSTNLRG